MTLLPAVLAEFAGHHPGIDVVVRTYRAESVAPAVAERREDLGLVACALLPGTTGVRVDALYREALVAIVRRGDPLAKRRSLPLRALAEVPLALVPPESPTGRVIVAACAQAGFVPRIRVVLDSGEGLREAVRDTGNVAAEALAKLLIKTRERETAK